MIVTLTEFKTDLDRYLELVGEEEIVLTKDGRQIASITPAPDEREAMLRSLRGILPPTVTLEEAHAERVAKHENHL